MRKGLRKLPIHVYSYLMCLQSNLYLLYVITATYTSIFASNCKGVSLKSALEKAAPQ